MHYLDTEILNQGNTEHCTFYAATIIGNYLTGKGSTPAEVMIGQMMTLEIFLMLKMFLTIITAWIIVTFMKSTEEMPIYLSKKAILYMPHFMTKIT